MNVVQLQLHDLYKRYLHQLNQTDDKVQVLNKWSNRLSSIYHADHTKGVHQFIKNWLKVINETKESIK